MKTDSTSGSKLPRTGSDLKQKLPANQATMRSLYAAMYASLKKPEPVATGLTTRSEDSNDGRVSAVGVAKLARDYIAVLETRNASPEVIADAIAFGIEHEIPVLLAAAMPYANEEQLNEIAAAAIEAPQLYYTLISPLIENPLVSDQAKIDLDVAKLALDYIAILETTLAAPRVVADAIAFGIEHENQELLATAMPYANAGQLNEIAAAAILEPGSFNTLIFPLIETENPPVSGRLKYDLAVAAGLIEEHKEAGGVVTLWPFQIDGDGYLTGDPIKIPVNADGTLDLTQFQKYTPGSGQAGAYLGVNDQGQPQGVLLEGSADDYERSIDADTGATTYTHNQTTEKVTIAPLIGLVFFTGKPPGSAIDPTTLQPARTNGAPHRVPNPYQEGGDVAVVAAGGAGIGANAATGLGLGAIAIAAVAGYKLIGAEPQGDGTYAVSQGTPDDSTGEVSQGTPDDSTGEVSQGTPDDSTGSELETIPLENEDGLNVQVPVANNNSNPLNEAVENSFNFLLQQGYSAAEANKMIQDAIEFNKITANSDGFADAGVADSTFNLLQKIDDNESTILVGTFAIETQDIQDTAHFTRDEIIDFKYGTAREQLAIAQERAQHIVDLVPDDVVVPSEAYQSFVLDAAALLSELPLEQQGAVWAELLGIEVDTDRAAGLLPVGTSADILEQLASDDIVPLELYLTAAEALAANHPDACPMMIKILLAMDVPLEEVGEVIARMARIAYEKVMGGDPYAVGAYVDTATPDQSETIQTTDEAALSAAAQLVAKILTSLLPPDAPDAPDAPETNGDVPALLEELAAKFAGGDGTGSSGGGGGVGPEEAPVAPTTIDVNSELPDVLKARVLSFMDAPDAARLLLDPLFRSRATSLLTSMDPVSAGPIVGAIPDPAEAGPILAAIPDPAVAGPIMGAIPDPVVAGAILLAIPNIALAGAILAGIEPPPRAGEILAAILTINPTRHNTIQAGQIVAALLPDNTGRAVEILGTMTYAQVGMIFGVMRPAQAAAILLVWPNAADPHLILSTMPGQLSRPIYAAIMQASLFSPFSVPAASP